MAHDNDELKIIPERDSLTPARISSPRSVRSGNLMLWGVTLTLAVGIGGVYLQNTQLTQLVQQQNTQLSQALNRVQKLEDELTATGRDLSKSGETLETRIQTNESEIRKLWDLSNKRNRKEIEDNDKQIAALKTQLANLLSEAKALQAAIKDESATRNTTVDALKTEQELLNTKLGNQQLLMTEQNSTQQQALSKLVESEAAQRNALKTHLSTEMTQLKQQIAALSTQQSQSNAQKASAPAPVIPDYSKVLAEHQNRLDAIDAARRQLTSSVTRLNSDMSNLQLEVDALLSGSGSSSN